MMTNATVADVAAAPDGRRLRLTYSDDEKTIVVPPDAPVVTFRPGDCVSIAAQESSGQQPTAVRINAGRAGFALAY